MNHNKEGCVTHSYLYSSLFVSSSLSFQVPPSPRPDRWGEWHSLDAATTWAQTAHLAGITKKKLEKLERAGPPANQFLPGHDSEVSQKTSSDKWGFRSVTTDPEWGTRNQQLPYIPCTKSVFNFTLYAECMGLDEIDDNWTSVQWRPWNDQRAVLSYHTIKGDKRMWPLMSTVHWPQETFSL